MEYYIMGSKKNAQKIRDAFAAQGNNVGDLDCSDELCLYFSFNGHIICTHRTVYQRLVKTHPDYKELKLPVEPKFKVGDKISWINHDCDTQTITDIRDGSYITVDKYGIRCALKFAKQDEWELVPPKPHYDIANLHAGMPVLVRDDESNDWRYVQFSHTRVMPSYRFVAGAAAWQQCIPFNDDTKHLLGTTDMCDEQYINW